MSNSKITGPLTVVGLLACLSALWIAYADNHSAHRSAEPHTPSIRPQGQVDLITSVTNPVSRTPIVQSSSPGLELIVGDVHVYALEYDARLHLESIDSGRQDELPDLFSWSESDPHDSLTSVRGDLVLTVLTRLPDGGWAFAANLEEPVVVITTAGTTRSVPDERLRVPCCVRIAPSGAVTSFGFAPGTNLRYANLWKSIWSSAFEFVPREARSPWTVGDLLDESGTFEATFSWTVEPNSEASTPELERRARHCTSARPGLPEVRHSDDPARVLLDHGWYSSGTGSQSSYTRIGAVDCTGRVQWRFERKSLARATSAELETRIAAEREWTDVADADGSALDESEIEAANRDDLATLVQELKRLAVAGELTSLDAYKLELRLAALLRIRPELLDEFSEMLLDGTFGEARGLAAAALSMAAAGPSDPALRLLAELILSHRASDDLKLELVMTSHALGAAGSVIAHPMLELLSSTRKEELQNAVLLLLGSLAAHGDSNNGAELRAVLESRFANNPGDEALALLLAAAGNSGIAELIAAHAIPAMHADSPAVRESAADALGRVHTAEAVALLLEAALRLDEDLPVRKTAIHSLGAQPLTSAILEGVGAIALHDPSVELRRTAVFMLGGELPNAEAEVLLSQVGVVDPSPELRAYAAEVLASYASQ